MMFTAQDQGNVGLGAAEEVGYLSLTHRASERSDLGYLIAGKQLLETCNEPGVDGVLSVGLVVNPFQIGNNVVGFNTVNVIYHREIIWIGHECERDKSMDVDRFSDSIAVEIDVLVTEFVGARSQNLAIDSPSLKPVADAIYASDASEIIDLIEISEVCDRNRSPFFSNDDIHMTGCPSGYVGSAIKDPSHAATFGGSAIMASDSDNYNRRPLCQ